MSFEPQQCCISESEQEVFLYIYTSVQLKLFLANPILKFELQYKNT